MRKLIAVWGCPGSGKTTFCAKLTKLIYDIFPTKVICILADPVMPALPLLFPNKKASEMYSIGAALSKTEITTDTVLEHLVTADEAREIGFIGYKDGENRWSYPEFSAEKAAALFDTAAALADFVIVDCGSDLTGLLSLTAISRADHIFRFYKPDLKAISFYSSQTPLYGDPMYRMGEQIPAMNVSENELYIPVQEMAQQCKCDIVIPYAAAVKQQMMDGRLMQNVPDKPWGNAMIQIVKQVVT